MSSTDHSDELKRVGWAARPNWERALRKQDAGRLAQTAKINQSVVSAKYAVMGKLYLTAQERRVLS